MEVVTVEQFMQILGQSGLLTTEQMAVAERAAPKAVSSEQLARFLVRQGLLTRWQGGQLVIGRANFTLGKYRLIDLLGKGGMGSVFLAEHSTMNRRVALKIVPKGIESDPAAMERFLAEARAIATVDHPNIVQAYSVDNDDGRYYIVMEYVEGKDLQRIVEEEGPLDYGRAADYVSQAAEGLAHAHGRGMIHCDIKPSNLLVNQQGMVKILDLGLARLSDKEQDSKDSKAGGPMLGTVDYMAPEQGLNADSFDHRADLYSLGCTLYFLLTGHAPFPEGTLAQRIVKHQTQQPQSIVEQRPDAPPQLVRVCRKLMAKNPDDRYASAAEVVRALAEWNTPRPLKRAEPLKEETTEEESTPAAESVADSGEVDLSRLVEDAATKRTPRRDPRRAGRGKALAAKKGRRSKPSRPVNIAPFIMWGAIGAVVALVGIAVAAVFMIKKEAADDPGNDRPRVVQPGPKGAEQRPVAPIAPQSHWPDANSGNWPTPGSAAKAPGAEKANPNSPKPNVPADKSSVK